jgi:hypothetical protein
LPFAAFGAYAPIFGRFVIREYVYCLPHGEPSSKVLSVIQA